MNISNITWPIGNTVFATLRICYLNAKEDGTLFFPLILSLVQFTRAHT